MATINTTTARIGVVANAATLTVTPVSTNERGTWYGFQEKYRLKRLHEEDDALMEVIHSFLKEAA